MTITGEEGGPISLSEASEMTANFRREFPSAIKARLFGKNILSEILDQEGCMGIRMYFALNSAGENELVIVGTDENGNDLLNLIADFAMPCPKFCPEDSPLNG